MTDKSNCWSSFFCQNRSNFYLRAAAFLGSARSIPRRQRCVDIAPQNTEILRAQLHFQQFLYDAALTWCAWLEPVLRPPPPESLGWLQTNSIMDESVWEKNFEKKKEKLQEKKNKPRRPLQTQTTMGAKGYMKEHNPFLFPPKSSGFLTSLL